MAYKVFEDYSTNETQSDSNDVRLNANGQELIELPEGDFVQNSELSRDGFDLILETDNGTVTIEGYFASTPTPDLVGPDGMHLTPDLVESFTQDPAEYANAGLSSSDASPIGAIQEISGDASITRADGTIEKVGLGTPVFQGDIVETDENGAVNIMFVDETTFAVSEDARLSIDEYVFDPATQSGTTNFSVLKGVFVFTSGLIGRDDPDDVMINTPSGSIGIRGTIIAGDVDTGEITVIEGAIVLHDFAGNSITLANQFETARFNSAENEIEHMGDLNANEVVSKFMSVSTVAANLFSSIEDAANDAPNQQSQDNSSDTSNTGNEQSTEQQQDGQDSESNTQNSQPEGQNASQDDTAQEETTEGQQSGEGETEGEEGASLETSDDTQEPQEGKGTTQANSSESEVTEIITSSDITGPDFSKLNQIVDKLKQQIGENNETTQSGNEIETSSPLPTTSDDINDQLPIEPEIDRSARVLDRAADEFFSGSLNTSFSYDFSQEFFDPFSTITGYTLTGLASPEIVTPSVVFSNSTGELSFDLDGMILGDSNFNFTVTANTTLGDFSQDFTFNVLAQNLNTTSIFPDLLLNNGTVFNGSHPTGVLRVNGNNVSAFGDNTANAYDVNGPSALIKAGGGNDTIDLSPSGGYHVYGETGNDTFTIAGGSLAAVYVNSYIAQIDGGVGNDVLEINNSGNLDFRLVNNNFIRNIEMLDFENGQANNITLTYSDVVLMTDDNNTLKIDMNSGDNLNFINNVGSTFESTGNVMVGPEFFESFTDGNITILVDNTEGSVTGL